MEAQKCEGIKRGEGMNIYDIAAEAGTSISTVSSLLPCFYNGISQLHSRLTKLIDTVYQNDRVIDGNTSQHDNTDNSHHIDSGSGNEEK